jgi:uncharacterized damage-inducible protein DinB
MSLAEALAAELKHEAGTTRRLIERVPDDKASWKPHVRSMSLGHLAIHLANIESYGVAVTTKPELNFAALDGSGITTAEWASRDETLALFDRNLEATLRAVSALPDPRLHEPWTLRAGDHVVFTLPRVAAWRSLVMSHQVHHRGQLSVYLRLNDIPVPPIYGPSADER